MKVIFGIPTGSIMVVLLVVFALCLALSALLFLRNRAVFRLGVRNVPRRPAQTILIVVGLMLSTLIIAASFATGDTLDSSIRGQVLDVYGQTDEQVVAGSSGTAYQGGARLPETLVADLESRFRGNPDVEGLLPVLAESLPVVDQRTRLFEPALTATGLDPARLGPFGPLADTGGKAVNLGALPADGVVLGKTAAEKLNASVGDTLLVYVQNQPHPLTVAAIGADSLLTGYTGASSAGGFALPLGTAQTLLGAPGQITRVDVTNRGGVQQSPAVMQALEAALAGTPYQAVDAQANELRTAEETGNAFLTIFLLFGLFSIAVGILLIFLIFVLLAAERKPEMGIARAVGMKRRHLTEMFLAEGLAYDLVSALVGAALGVLVAFAMAGFMARIFGQAFPIRPTVTWQSLVIAYTLGVVVTFVSIVISAWRVSRLNIVTAIRDTPDPVPVRESRRWLIFGALGVALGALLVWVGATTGQEFPFATGMCAVPLSLAVLLRRFGVPARLVFTVAAFLVLFYFLMPSTWSGTLFPHLTAGIEMFFLSGILLVAAATVIIVWNATLLTFLVGVLGRASARWLPAVKIAVAYPLERKGRTGMTISMFSLIVFSLVVMAAINDNVMRRVVGTGDVSAGWDVMAVQGQANPITDFSATLVAHGVDTGQIAATSRLQVVPWQATQVLQVGGATTGQYQVVGIDRAFIDNSRLPLQTRATGYDSDAAVWAAVLGNPDVAVIDSTAIPSTGTIRVGGPTFQLQGVSPDTRTMQPVALQVTDPLSGKARTIQVIGVLDSRVAAFSGVMVSDQTFGALFDRPLLTEFEVKLEPGVKADQMAKTIESALVSYGIQADSYQAMVDTSTRYSRGFLTIIEGFMLLGLVVGIAALGVISFRSVVERRQQIGMLRAIGYTRSMVVASFVIESGIITLLGILSGAALGLVLSRKLITSNFFIGGSGAATFVVPWGQLFVFFAIALAAGLLMAYAPARRAARVTIAEALRYE